MSPKSKRLWNVDESSSNFQFYFDFIQVIANIKYDNFINLKRFANHPVLNKTTKFTMIAFEMKKNALKPGQAFSPVITEVKTHFIHAKMSFKFID